MVSPALESATLGKALTQAAATLTAVLATAAADTYFLSLRAAVGDPVRLTDDGGDPIFTGSIHAITRREHTVTLTAFDRGIYLKRNELSGVYAGTGRQTAARIAGELGIPLGSVCDDGVRRVIIAGAGRSAFSILRDAVGSGYEIRAEDGTLRVCAPSGQAAAVPRERILSASSQASIRAMVNRAVVVGRNGRVLAAAGCEADAAAYGQFRRVLGSGGDPAALASAALSGRQLTGSVTVLGDLALHCGGLAALSCPQWGLNGRWRITAHTHRWEKGLFTTTLALEEEP